MRLGSDLSNGVILRSKPHHLFDQSYLAVTLEFHIEVNALVEKATAEEMFPLQVAPQAYGDGDPQDIEVRLVPR